MRNIQKHADEARKIIEKKCPRRDMTVPEMYELLHIANDLENPDGLIDAIITAYLFGFRQGHKAGKE